MLSKSKSKILSMYHSSSSKQLSCIPPLSVSSNLFRSVQSPDSVAGERRIRVVTLALPTTNTMSEVFAGVDQIALVTFLANKAVERSLSAKLEDARDAIINKLVEIFTVYKTTMTSAGQGASPQLVTSDTMKFLPLLLLGLLKHVRRPTNCLKIG